MIVVISSAFRLLYFSHMILDALDHAIWNSPIFTNAVFEFQIKTQWKKVVAIFKVYCAKCPRLTHILGFASFSTCCRVLSVISNSCLQPCEIHYLAIFLPTGTVQTSCSRRPHFPTHQTLVSHRQALTRLPICSFALFQLFTSLAHSGIGCVHPIARS